jgi:hypothetical protein
VVTACLFAPACLLGVQIGSIADRHSWRRLLVIADCGRLVVYLGLGPLLWVAPSTGSIAGVILLALAAGALDALFGAALNGYIASAVPAAGLVRVNSYLEATDAGASLAGPALAGAILQAVSIIGVLALSACSTSQIRLLGLTWFVMRRAGTR